MPLYAVIFDTIPPFVGGDRRADYSLLRLPFGTEDGIDRILATARFPKGCDIYVCPTFDPDEAYVSAIAAAGERAGREVSVVSQADLQDLFHRAEPADRFLLVEPRYWPPEGLDLGAWVTANEGRMGVCHLIGSPTPPDDVLERVQTDGEGRVVSIRRICEKVTWQPAGEVAVVGRPARSAG